MLGLAPFPMEERAGLYVSRTKKSIVEECNSASDKCQPVKIRKTSWAEIVKGGKSKI